MHVEEQMEETAKVFMNTLNERMKRDMEILCSMKGIGENTATNFLIEMGGAVEIYENDKKLIAASGLDPSTCYVDCQPQNLLLLHHLSPFLHI
jgi:transposase